MLKRGLRVESIRRLLICNGPYFVRQRMEGLFLLQLILVVVTAAEDRGLLNDQAHSQLNSVSPLPLFVRHIAEKIDRGRPAWEWRIRSSKPPQFGVGASGSAPASGPSCHPDAPFLSHRWLQSEYRDGPNRGRDGAGRQRQDCTCAEKG